MKPGERRATGAYSSGFNVLDEATRGGIHPGHPWLIIDDRDRAARSKWFPGAAVDTGAAEKNVLTVVRDPNTKLVRSRIGRAVLNDEALIVVVGFRSQDLESACSVVLRVMAGEIVMTKNSMGPKVRVRMPS